MMLPSCFLVARRSIARMIKGIMHYFMIGLLLLTGMLHFYKLVQVIQSNFK